MRHLLVRNVSQCVTCWLWTYVFLYSFFFFMHTDFIALKLMSSEVSLGSNMNFKNKKSSIYLYRAVETL